MLSSAEQHKSDVDRLIFVGLAAASQSWPSGSVDRLARLLVLLQVRAARGAVAAVGRVLAQQSIEAPPAATVAPQAFSTASDGRTLAGLLEQADTLPKLQTMTVTQITDTDRVATGVATTIRPAVSGHIRNVGATCCSRCAILAGQFYRYSDGFKRHPGCRCTMVPTTRGTAHDEIDSPEDLFLQGRITDLSQRDAQAVRDGADLGKVVNVRRKAAGLTVAGRVIARRDGRRRRLTPEGIYDLASDRDDAIRLLAKYGYII